MLRRVGATLAAASVVASEETRLGQSHRDAVSAATRRGAPAMDVTRSGFGPNVRHSAASPGRPRCFGSPGRPERIGADSDLPVTPPSSHRSPLQARGGDGTSREGHRPIFGSSHSMPVRRHRDERTGDPREREHPAAIGASRLGGRLHLAPRRRRGLGHGVTGRPPPRSRARGCRAGKDAGHGCERQRAHAGGFGPMHGLQDVPDQGSSP